ncbi:MAG: hypothetical protein NVS3B1_23600 [Marmoricola sp.]
MLPVECRAECDYWAGLKAHWDTPGPLLNVEHDMDVSDRHLQTLVDCPHDACSWAYHTHWASTGLSSDVIAARSAEWNDPAANYLQGGEEWAAWSAIGLVKITARARIAPLRREPWTRVELAVNDATARPWHMHWPPLTHHHF